MSIAQDWLGQHDTNLWGGSGAGSGLGVGGVTNMRSMGGGARRMGQKQWWEYPGMGGASASASVQQPQRQQFSPLYEEIGGYSPFSQIDQSPIMTQNQIDRKSNKIQAGFDNQAQQAVKQVDSRAMSPGASGGLGRGQQANLKQNALMQARMGGTGAVTDFTTDMAQRNREQISQNQALRQQGEIASGEHDIRRRQKQIAAVAPLGPGEVGHSALLKELNAYQPGRRFA